MKSIFCGLIQMRKRFLAYVKLLVLLLRLGAIFALSEHADNIKVHFHSSHSRDFDPVIAADGLGSATRKLVSGNTPISSLGQYVSWLSIPRA
jgi:2-polyprenyl-6-methoxyphenol hydroxylase-like FAD-dependent oxidoreductase